MDKNNKDISYSLKELQKKTGNIQYQPQTISTRPSVTIGPRIVEISDRTNGINTISGDLLVLI